MTFSYAPDSLGDWPLWWWLTITPVAAFMFFGTLISLAQFVADLLWPTDAALTVAKPSTATAGRAQGGEDE